MNDTKDFSWEVVKNLGNFSEGRMSMDEFRGILPD